MTNRRKFGLIPEAYMTTIRSIGPWGGHPPPAGIFLWFFYCLESIVFPNFCRGINRNLEWQESSKKKNQEENQEINKGLELLSWTDLFESLVKMYVNWKWPWYTNSYPYSTTGQLNQISGTGIFIHIQSFALLIANNNHDKDGQYGCIYVTHKTSYQVEIAIHLGCQM